MVAKAPHGQRVLKVVPAKRERRAREKALCQSQAWERPVSKAPLTGWKAEKAPCGRRARQLALASPEGQPGLAASSERPEPERRASQALPEWLTGSQESEHLPQAVEEVPRDSRAVAMVQRAKVPTRRLAGARMASASPMAGKVRLAVGPESRSPDAAAPPEVLAKRAPGP